MKKHLLLSLLALIMISAISFSQQALFGGANIISPEVNADNSVTFRFQAPDAKEVKLTGDWMPAQGWTPGSELMTKDDKGLWSYTTAPLASDLYSYSFTVDGLRNTDPNNVYMIRDVATVTNVFIVGRRQGRPLPGEQRSPRNGCKKMVRLPLAGNEKTDHHLHSCWIRELETEIPGAIPASRDGRR